jgi:hypothetical protein
MHEGESGKEGGEGRGEAAFQFWNALWEGCRPRPAHSQYGLFNPLLAAELSLSYLERCSMSEVCWALFQHNISHASHLTAAYIHAATSDTQVAHMYTDVVTCLNDALHGITDGNAAIRVLSDAHKHAPAPASKPAAVPLRIEADEEDGDGSKESEHVEAVCSPPHVSKWKEGLSSLHHASLRLHTTALPLILDVYTYATRMLQLRCLFEATAEDAAAIKAGNVLATQLCNPHNNTDISPPWHGGWHINTDEPSHITCTSPHELCVPDVDAEGDVSTFWSRLRAFASLRFMPLQAGRLKRAGGHSRGMPGGSVTDANLDENASVSIPLLSSQRNYAQDALHRGRAYFMTGPAIPPVIQGTYPSLNGEGTHESEFIASFPTPLLSAREAWTSPPISHKPRNVLEQSALVHIRPEEDPVTIQCVISSIAAFSTSVDTSTRSSPASYSSNRFMWSTAKSVLDELAPVPDSRVWIFRTERKNDETHLSTPLPGGSSVLSPAASSPQVCFRFCTILARDGSVALSQSAMVTQHGDEHLPENSV